MDKITVYKGTDKDMKCRGFTYEIGKTPVCVKAEIVDGERIKANVWYTLKDGEFVGVEP